MLLLSPIFEQILTTEQPKKIEFVQQRNIDTEMKSIMQPNTPASPKRKNRVE